MAIGVKTATSGRRGDKFYVSIEDMMISKLDFQRKASLEIIVFNKKKVRKLNVILLYMCVEISMFSCTVLAGSLAGLSKNRSM